jgi:hypothetical protein
MLRKYVRKWRDFYNSYCSMWITLRVMIDIEGPLISFSISLIGGAHIGARALLDIKSIRFNNIVCLTQWGGGFFLLVQMI